MTTKGAEARLELQLSAHAHGRQEKHERVKAERVSARSASSNFIIIERSNIKSWCTKSSSS
jgi:hypothetical protein